jgi:hypothetical protein
LLLGAEAQGVDACRVVMVLSCQGEGLVVGLLVGHGWGAGVGRRWGSNTSRQDPASFTLASRVCEDGKLGAVEGVVGWAAVLGGEGNKAGIADVNAERCACAQEACGQVWVLVAAVASEPPALVPDRTAGSQAFQFGRAEVAAGS